MSRNHATFVPDIVGGVYNDWVGRESVEIPDREMSSPVFPMEQDKTMNSLSLSLSLSLPLSQIKVGFEFRKA